MEIRGNKSTTLSIYIYMYNKLGTSINDDVHYVRRVFCDLIKARWRKVWGVRALEVDCLACWPPIFQLWAGWDGDTDTDSIIDITDELPLPFNSRW